MIFETEVNDEKVSVKITHYHPDSDMVITGWGYGDCIEGDYEEIEWTFVDKDENPIHIKIDDETNKFIEEEALSEARESFRRQREDAELEQFQLDQYEY